MKVVELLKVGQELLKLLSKSDIKVTDYQYINAYEDFLNMRANRIKYREVIRILANENHVSERTLERIFKRLSKIVNC